jgi:uncharacterized membrane protein YdfJ with MMPL/SSD domain
MTTCAGYVAANPHGHLCANGGPHRATSGSVAAMMRTGKVFEEFDSDSSAMIVLEGDQPLGEDAHRFYDDMVDKLNADTKHVQHVQDFWGDPLTRAGAQSQDGKAAYVQVYLAGNMGETLGKSRSPRFRNSLRDCLRRRESRFS